MTLSETQIEYIRRRLTVIEITVREEITFIRNILEKIESSENDTDVTLASTL